MDDRNYKVPGKKLKPRDCNYREMVKVGMIPPTGNKYATGYRRMAKACKHLHLVDHSYGGPETGCVHLVCSRCGYTYHTTLY